MCCSLFAINTFLIGFARCAWICTDIQRSAFAFINSSSRNNCAASSSLSYFVKFCLPEHPAQLISPSGTETSRLLEFNGDVTWPKRSTRRRTVFLSIQVTFFVAEPPPNLNRSLKRGTANGLCVVCRVRTIAISYTVHLHSLAEWILLRLWCTQLLAKEGINTVVVVDNNVCPKTDCHKIHAWCGDYPCGELLRD